jgi:RNA polymerase II subunit A small phosphatase-like protein
MTKLVRKLMPCRSVAPSDHAHATDVDSHNSMRYKITESANGGSAPLVEANVSSEKQDEVKETERGKPTPVTITSPPSTQTNFTEVDVVVSLTPAMALLPRFETEGVTSGAVQPPGSTGTDIFSPSQLSHGDAFSGGTKSHAGGISLTATDSEDSFTELEDGQEVLEIEEVEPMEDALILNGGTGIPIGPVSLITFYKLRLIIGD